MKNFLIFIALMAFFVGLAHSPANAQINPFFRTTQNPFHYGIKGGVHFSNLYTRDVENTNMRRGFNFGLFARLPLVHRVAFQPEIYYMIKGADVTYQNAFVTGVARYSFHYFETPLLLRYNVNRNFNVHAGPYFAFLVSGRARNQTAGNLFDFERNINSRDFSRFDSGLAMGLGLDLGILGVGLRYSHGFLKVGREKSFPGTTYTFPDGRHGVFNFYASMALNRDKSPRKRTR
jgi:hypothetical protein